jgi:cysteinyl-tRNA synthetase
MITIQGKKMGKSYNNVIKLTELFSGDSPILEQAYSPMTIRFFILQSHYRGTLDFSNEALQASEKALKRLWEAYEWYSKQSFNESSTASDPGLNEKVQKLVTEFDEFMNDDFSTAKVLANMFELSSVINSIKDRHISENAMSGETGLLLQKQLKAYLEDVFGLIGERASDNGQLDGILQLLISIRKDAKSKKDFMTSDKIRNELAALGVQLKDEKDGGTSYNFN